MQVDLMCDKIKSRSSGLFREQHDESVNTCVKWANLVVYIR